jgi:hypothetical protein
MPKYHAGDRVTCVGPHIPKYLGAGTVLNVIPHPDQIDGLVQYEVRFMFGTAVFYESQLTPAAFSVPKDHNCNERNRLIDAYNNACNAYIGATSSLADAVGMVADVEFEFLRTKLFEIKRRYREAKDRLKTHVAEHGC